jgi:hypothetical protein
MLMATNVACVLSWSFVDQQKLCTSRYDINVIIFVI